MRLFSCLCLAALLPLFSCSARINGSLAANGSASLSVGMSMEPRMASLVRSLSAAAGQTDRPILDGPAIAKSMSDASSGNVSATLRNTSPASVEGTIKISNISRFLAVGDVGGFITFKQGSSGGNCEIKIDLDNGPVLLSVLSPEISDYLNALMAPLATGEKLRKPEYLELVVSVYSKAISDEIASSRIRASIDFPGVVTSVKGGTFSGKKASFDIPLLDLLVLETPLSYEVKWN
ncbi:MAG: hypothetical protein LBQ82_09160 [Treponema sp.]|nr:hypothetical protein [Treponema sp.]